MTKSLWLFLFLFLATALPVRGAADDGMNAGLVYGKQHSFLISAPAGWVLDNQSGAAQGLHAVFYPQGSSWKYSAVVMYANTARRKKGDTLDSFINYDVSVFRDQRRAQKIEDGPSLATGDGRRVPVKYFLGDLNGNYEAVAYVEEKYIVVYLVMTSRSEELFNEDLPAFQKLVASYKFVTENVKEETHQPPPIDFSVSASILDRARKTLKTPLGSRYDQQVGEDLGPSLAGFMKECASGSVAIGWHRVVIALRKDGTVTHIYAEKHDKVNDCLAPRFQGLKFPPAPTDPYYYLFELKVSQ